MRRTVLVLFLMFTAVIIFAQSPDMWLNIRNSAYTQQDSIYLRCETANNLVNTEMYYSTQNGWNESSLTNLTGVTFQGSAYFNNQSPLYVRYRSMLDTFVVMQTAYVANDVATPNYQKLGFVVNDLESDNTLPIDCLDIKSTYFAVSDTRLYAGMENFIHDYPQNNGGYVPTEFYFYIAGLLNPETAWQDTIMYAMVYGNVPMLLEPGLYKVHGTQFSTDAIERIGDINYDDNQNALVMSCNINDLINDPDFGEWPNLSNSLVYNFFTVKTGLDGTATIVDYTKTSQQIFNYYAVQPFQNHIPQISQANAVTGVVNTNISATYSDQDNNFPLIAIAEVHHSDGSEDTQYNLSSAGFDYAGGVNFVAQIPETEWESITIKFSDNNSDFAEQTLYPQSSENDIISTSAKVRVFPNPFASTNSKNSMQFVFDFSAYKNAILTIYNLKGEKITDLKDAGKGKIVWEINKNLKNGVYLYKIKGENNAETGKFTIIK